MTRCSILVFALALACGSSPPPKADDASDADTDSPSDVEQSDMGESSGQSADSGEAAPSEKSESSGATTSADVQAVLQAVIEDDALQPYLHLEEPGRFPLRIAGSVLPSGLQLTKGNKPVEVVDASLAADKKTPVLVFTELEVKGDRATAVFRYDIEKVRGSATVEKKYGTWTILKSRITEREVTPAASPK